jgi:hypothetical protein
MFFHTEKKIFRNGGYSFYHQILTDGVSVCLLFEKKKKKPEIIPEHDDFTYVDKLCRAEREIYSLKNLVGMWR